jgi:glycosyltransferase involved in cell wall biosynthesis
VTPHLFAVGRVWPEPRSSAAGWHFNSLLRVFRDAGWRVSFGSPAAPGPLHEGLSELDISTHRLAVNCESFDALMASEAPDVVLFDRFVTEEQFGWRVAEQLPRAVRVLDTEDLHCLRGSRERALRAGISWSEALLHHPLTYREVASILRSDLALVLSDFEIELLTRALGVPASQLVHTPFLLDSSVTPVPRFEEREGFVWLGGFLHGPNVDSVTWLAQELWPALRARAPVATVRIYGSHAGAEVLRLHQPERGFFVEGWCADAPAELRRARVLLAPLRYGAGLKGKIAEAMLTGTPTCTTSVGAEGMAEAGAFPGAVEDVPHAFVEAALRLHFDANAWDIASAQCDTVLRERFAADATAARLLSAVEGALVALDAHRGRHFLGAMLRHHTLQSTRYLAKWIVAKNAAASK